MYDRSGDSIGEIEKGLHSDLVLPAASWYKNGSCLGTKSWKKQLRFALTGVELGTPGMPVEP